MSVTCTPLDAARLVTWDRQARRNAWDVPTMEAIAEAIASAGADPEVRVVVVRGAGGHFSAGDDLFAALEADAAAWAATIDAFQRLTRVVLELPVPVVAALEGAVVGGALEFAASCDVRIGTRDVRLATPEVTIGLVATNAGTLLLPEVLGESAARDLLLTGAPKDAGWAHAHGFLTEVVDDLDDAVERWTAMFDGTSRAAVARTKVLLNGRFGRPPAEAMDAETAACVDLFGEPDARAALRAFADSRRRG